MPTRERVNSLVEYVKSGRIIEAYTEFYADDVVMQDNREAPRIGLEANIARQKAALEQAGKINGFQAVTAVVDGDHAVIEWVLDGTDKQGKDFRLEELAISTWRGDKIIHERFYYDTASLQG